MTAAKKTKLSASLEDYLEAIYNISSDNNIARSRDIATELSVSRASVTGALRLLQKKGLCDYEPYGYINLTEAGRVKACDIARKHQILNSFFIKVLDIEPEIAQNAACKAEHALGQEIIAKLLLFIDFAGHNSINGNDLITDFRQFCQNHNTTLREADSGK